ncbi:MAG: sigma-70 family RNA polymerase sigma factor [Planctomycetes bacterium]|nr:sigma-70 family RNA polymerase sigma factor [Planctomycetota bacterium]
MAAYKNNLAREKNSNRSPSAAHAMESQNDRFFDRFYGELRALAGYHLSRERTDHTLQPTALAHEAYMRMSRQTNVIDVDRVKFLSVASEMIRRILVDHARHRNTTKRGGKRQRFALDEIRVVESGEEPVDTLDLDSALKELATLNARQARVVELRFFAGLSVAETAASLGISEGSAKGDWRFARAWLRARLSR